jgi:hypothetical protein
MNSKKIAVTAAMTAGLGMAALGVGAGAASADDFDVPFLPDIPFVPGPGVLPPPGQVGHVIGVPPGHWDDVLPVHIPGLPGLFNHL